MKFFLKPTKSIALLLSVLVFITGCSSSSSSVLVGEKAPFTKFTLMDGSYRTSDNYKGKYLVVLFWATTCSRAHSTLDEITEWSKKARSRRNLSVITVSIDKASNEDKVRKALEGLDRGIIEHAFSGNDIYDEAYIAYDVDELPTVLLIDPSGKVVARGSSVDVLDQVFQK